MCSGYIMETVLDTAGHDRLPVSPPLQNQLYPLIFAVAAVDFPRFCVDKETCKAAMTGLRKIKGSRGVFKS